MSLINEALKKAAQRQSPSSDSLTPNANPPLPAAPANHHTPKVWVIAAVLTIIGLALIASITFIIWLFVVPSDNNPAPTASNTLHSTSDSAPATTTVERIAFTPPVATSAPAPEVPETKVDTPPALQPADTRPPPATQPVSSPQPAPPADSTRTAPVADISPQPAKPPPPPAPPPQPKANPAVETYIQGLQIRGVMAGGGKVLLYKSDTQRTHAYEVGAVLDGQLNVLIYRIQERQIQFRDNDGFIYTKRF